jgi:DNA polymerase-3 subunit delta'
VSWHSIRGHDGVVASLKRSAARGRLPHALLFVGPEGVGKRTFALTFAQALLCERADESALDPCEACPSCRQVKSGNHPDLLQVARPPDKHDLPIALIRDLCLDLGLKPMKGGRKVAIVDDADAMNDEAANAFLKTLEEPPPGSVLILIATSAEAQLETILSRCRIVRFDPLSEPELAAVLLEQELAADPVEAARLAKLGEGSVSRARGLASPAIESFRRDLLDALSDPRGFDPPALAKRVHEFVKDAGTESVDQRQRATLLMGELARFFRGVLWQTAGLEPPSPDPDDRRAIADLAERLSPEDVFVLADRALDAAYHIERKAYMPLVLESLTHDLGALINPQG